MEINYFVCPGLEETHRTMLRCIETLVYVALGISELQVRAKTRKREAVEARQLVYYMVWKQLNMTLEKIGAIYNQNHATVSHAVKTISNLLETNKEFQQKVKGIIELKTNN